jgi:hypothetical protein
MAQATNPGLFHARNRTLPTFGIVGTRSPERFPGGAWCDQPGSTRIQPLEGALTGRRPAALHRWLTVPPGRLVLSI